MQINLRLSYGVKVDIKKRKLRCEKEPLINGTCHSRSPRMDGATRANGSGSGIINRDDKVNRPGNKSVPTVCSGRGTIHGLVSCHANKR